MHTLHITAQANSRPLALVKGLRGARIILQGNAHPSLAGCQQTAQDAIESGWSLVGEHADLEVVQRAANVLVNEASHAGAEAKIDWTPPEAAPIVALPPNDERAAYETALLFMAITNGNPLVACSHAFNMGRTTNSPEFYADVIRALLRVFPWNADSLTEAGIVL